MWAGGRVKKHSLPLHNGSGGGKEPMVRYRVRIRFRKEGDLRLISHRDLMRTFERLFRRAQFYLAQSEGMHPRALLRFPSALGLGIVGIDEVLETELTEVPKTDELLASLRSHAPPGLEIQCVDVVPPGTAKAALRRATYELLIPADRRAEITRRAAELMSSSTCTIEQPTNGRSVDVRATLDLLEMEDDVLRIRLRAAADGGVSPRNVLTTLGMNDLQEQGSVMTRTCVELR